MTVKQTPMLPLPSSPAGWAIPASLAVAAVSAYGHPGHAPGGHGLLHEVADPHHRLALILTGTLLFAVARVLRTSRHAHTLQRIGALLLLGGLVPWGLEA